MVRAFSVNFPYKGRSQSALVSFREEGYELSFLVRYVDEEIKQLIPGGRIIVSLSEGIKSHKQLSKPADDLVCNTCKAISRHLYFQEIL
jgi:hypothetical protein